MTVLAHGHDASASLDGGLAQFDYALLLLAEGIHRRVGIETLDDVVAESPSGSTERTQLKQSLAKKGYSITLRSLQLWKTLAIWADAVQVDPGLCETTRFVLVATRVSAAEPIAQLSKVLSADACHQLAASLLAETNTPSEDLRDAMTRVKQLGAPGLAKLLSRIQLRQMSVAADAEELKRRLQVPSRVNSDHVVEGLRGWIISAARRAWSLHTPCWIDQAAFNTRRHELFKAAEKRLKAVRAWHKVTDGCDPSTVDKNSTFLRQLRLVGADREELQEAVIDMLKHRIERQRLASLGEVDDDDFTELEDALVGCWHPKWRAMRDSRPETARAAGLKLYREVLQLQPPQLTGELQIHQPYCRGGYQQLANECRVGWHPRYKEELEVSDSLGPGAS